MAGSVRAKIIREKDFQTWKFAPTDVGGYGTEAATDVNPR
jgi:hypothetical protein